MLKVIIADDQDLIRESLKIVLDINEDIQVVGMACNLLVFLHRTRQFQRHRVQRLSLCVPGKAGRRPPLPPVGGRGR